MRLRDKVALITGSGRGIGRVTALRFAQEGTAIIVNYRYHVLKQAQNQRKSNRNL